MFERFYSYITQLDTTDCKIFLHHNADPDAICAAESLGILMEKINPKLSYEIFTDDINYSSKRIISELNIDINETDPSWSEEKNKLIVTVDTANLSQLGKYAEWVDSQDSDIIVFDHHDTREISKIAKLTIYDGSSSSTCVLIERTYQIADIKPTPRVATLLLSGHIYDSRRFLYGSSQKVFEQMAFLISCGGDYELSNEVLQNEMSHGEKIARFKSASRLKYSVIEDVIIITSKIGAFEASSARNFIGMGADIAMVIAPRDKELRASARMRSHLPLNIGEIMSQLAEEYNGSGGGHAEAAGFNIPTKVSRKTQSKIRNRFVKMVEEKLKKL